MHVRLRTRCLQVRHVKMQAQEKVAFLELPFAVASLIFSRIYACSYAFATVCVCAARVNQALIFFLSLLIGRTAKILTLDWLSIRFYILVGFLILYTTTNIATASERLTFNLSFLLKKINGNRMLNKTTTKKFFGSRRLVVSGISFTPLRLL